MSARTERLKGGMARLRRMLEPLFLALCCAYWLYRAAKATTLGVPWPSGFERKLLVAMAVVAAARLALGGPKRWETWAGIAMAAVYGMVYRSDGYRFLLFLAVQTVGLIGVDYRRVMKAYLAVTGCLLLAVVFAALAGAVNNVVGYRIGQENGVRSSWGLPYPTDLSAAALYALLTLWVVWRGAPEWAFVPLGLAGVYLSLRITDSRNSLLAGGLFLVAVAYCWLEGRALEKRRGLRWIPRAVNGLMTAVFPLLACAIFAMVWFYSRGTALGERLNTLLSERLANSLESYRAHGVRAFGTPFSQVGFGGSAFAPLNYSFVDSSYVLILLRYGWVTLAMLAASWGWTVRQAIRCRDRRLALTLGIIAFHCFMEHHFTDIHMNVLVVLPLAAYPARPEAAEGAAARRGIVAAALVAALLAAAGVLGLPGLLTRLRTVFRALGWQGKGLEALPAVGVGALALALIAGFAWALYRVLRRLLGRERPGAWAPAAAALCLALGAAGWLWAGGVVDAASEKYAARLEANAPGLELVLDAAEGGVYVSRLPEVYMRRFPGVRATVLPEDDLARCRGGTAILDAKKDHRVFFQNGFLYAQLSDTQGVYSSDPAVLAALESAGYTLTNLFPREKEMDLEYEARVNRLPLDENGLLLAGERRAVKSAPYEDLYGGVYEAVYRLALTDESRQKRVEAGEDVEVCTLKVDAYKGESVVATQRVYTGEFDENGELTVALPFFTESVRNARFLISAKKGWGLYVRGISYRQTQG